MTGVANLLTRQRFALDQLVKIQTNYKKDPKTRKTNVYYRNLIEKVKSIHSQYDEVHERILESVDEKLISSPYFTDEYERFESIRINFLSELEELLQASQPTEESNEGKVPKEAKGEDDLKLPRISLPKFSGKYDEWISFHDLFVSLIHNRTSLSKVEKLHYLKCSLSGEAENLLRHFAVTESNYDVAWKLLSERYDNKRVLLNTQFRNLFNIDSATESSDSIKLLLDQTVECVQAMENLKLGDLWQSIIIYLTAERLPQETRQLWEQEQALNSKLPSFDELKTFLNNRFRALEASGLDRSKHRQKHLSVPRRVHSLQANAHPSQSTCTQCKGSHRLAHCAQFRQLPHAQKFELVKRNGLCLNCLEKGHLVGSCPSRFKCMKCKRSHHTLLHREEIQLNYQVDGHASTQQRVNLSVNTSSGTNRREVLLATALINVQSPSGLINLRALLDQGSQVSLITEHAVQRLGLKRKGTNINVSGIGNSIHMNAKGEVNLNIVTRNKNTLDCEAIILDKLTSLIPSQPVHIVDCYQLRSIELADTQFNRPGQIDVILGADIFARIILGEIRRLNKDLVAQNTQLGWVVFGQTDTQATTSYQSYKVEVNRNEELNGQLQRFWELEEIPHQRSMTDEDIACEKYFLETVQRDTTGRFIVRLPFKPETGKNALGHSRASAVSSFLSLEKRLKADTELNAEYTACINDYIARGHMEPAKDTIDQITENGKPRGKACYLPHHAVRKESSSTHCRVVFDASRKTSSGLSLNDVLITGPAIQNELTTVIMQWRWYRYAFVADIAKMYRQIRMHEEDINYQRILWRPHPSGEIQDYCLNTVTFGVTCAPFLAIRCLKKLAEMNKDRCPRTWHAVESEFYVDDLLSGGHSILETIDKRKEIDDVLKSGGFELRKWITNDLRIIEDIKEDDIEMHTTLDLNLERNYNSLGILWNPFTDQFSYKIGKLEPATKCSKRQLLSEIAKLYDPLGWISPIIINSKILLQSLWLQGLSWDEPLSNEIMTTWSKLNSSLHELKNLRIPRWIDYTNGSIVELHGFSDASSKAYAAAIYITVRNNARVTSHLVTAKTKVAPIRPVSIPRLELCGAVLLAKLMAKVKLALNLVDTTTRLWTDSKVVLAWLKGHPSRWTVFVANRTTTIFDAVGNSPWYHVPTQDNPADLASRGIEARQIIDNYLWWHGPAWLVQDENHWPISHEVSETKIELKRALLVNFAGIKKAEMELILSKYSTLNRLVRVTAYCFRFCALTLKRTEDKGYLKTEELKSARNIWIKFTQQNEFHKEISSLRNDEQIDDHSRLVKLHPFLDSNGILRVGGRLTEANLPYDAKHPIILPRKGRFVELLVQQAHNATLHGQTQLTLNILRRHYWIVDARNSIKREIHKCVKCFRANPRLSSQLMGNLPMPRVNISRPFTHTGVDYCGPFEYRDRRGRGSKVLKGYIAVFVCLAVKALHLEFVSDLSTASFLAALKRFTARRGLCMHLYSDCGTNFVGANAELQRVVKSISKFAAEATANNDIVWHFNPPASPHFGGLWEAGVKSVKQHLRRVVVNAILTFEEITTVLAQIEACLNSRPLCPLSDDPLDLEVLTPAHFLIGGPLLAPPAQDLLNIKTNYLDRWQLTQRLVQNFWSKWKGEYLTRLQSRPKWLKEKPGPQVGDMCLLKHENNLPYKWPLARIVKVHPGKDSLVRVVTVFANGKTLTRPIAKIALLPIASTTSTQ